MTCKSVENVSEILSAAGAARVVRPSCRSGQSRRRRAGLLFAPAACALLAGTSLANASWAQAAEGPHDSAQLATTTAGVAEVVVTARKTRERLADVPIAITAVSGDQLRANDHLRIEDLNVLAPSMNSVEQNGHQTSVTIRGLGANPGNDGLENSAGVFLDGVYLGRPGMVDTDLIDIDHVEVLRGPQGTLFGKNTTAGVVSIMTEAPRFDFGATVQASYGNYNYQQYQGTITGPIVNDVLAFRLTANSTTRDGDIHDISTDQNVNNISRQGVRGQLLYTPTPNFRLRLIGEFEHDRQSTGGVLLIETLGQTPAAIATKLAAVGGVSLVPDPTGRTTYDGGPFLTGTQQGALSAEANWTLGGYTLTSITAWRSWKYNSDADEDLTIANVLNGGYNINDNQYSEEFRLKFPRTGPVDAVIGVYYFNQGVHTDSFSNYGPEAAAWLTGIPDALLPTYAKASPAVATTLNYDYSRSDTIATPETNSYAAFGQAVWHVDPRWNITAGLRVTYETKEESVYRPQPISTITGGPIAAFASQAVAPFTVGIRGTAPSFLISTDYHFAPSMMAYASVAQGQKAGGVNPTLPAAGRPISSLEVLPETATDYEIGVKGDLFQHRLDFNLDAFYTHVDNYQATYLAYVNGSVQTLLTNVGKVQTEGVEADLTARPIRGLSVTANGSFNDAYYASYTNGPCAVENVGQTICNLTGRPLAQAPRWIANLITAYEHPLGDDLIVHGTAEYAFRSKFYGSPDDSQYTLTGGFGLLNLRLGIRSARGGWDLSLWGKNVTDKRYANLFGSLGSLLPGTYYANFADPATYGVTVRKSF